MMDDHGFHIFGRQAVMEALHRAPETLEAVLIQENRKKDVQPVLALCREAGVKFQFVPKSKLDGLSKGAHQGYGAKCFQPGFVSSLELIESAPKARLPVIVALDQVQDSGNVGTLARSVYALGGCGLALMRHRGASLGQRAHKAASGALSMLPIARITNMARFLATCQDRNIGTYYAGTDERCRSIFATEIIWPAVLVLGNEEKGVRPLVAKSCTAGVTLPMSGAFDSLNVAQAGSMLLAEFLRQHLAQQES
ncbi:TrmH family RNA methyltransferase [Desulfovermiculus halophilus]|jgi:23S rRNA (guanosine2251-2'-O)-methyltransferase|uniref:TrmH family RNA methyltransferase n=1 Tax=Desulfovermiculus halophilus TaxID=339722 RepID=UPI000685A45E|nr:RNA methyltransferase [Desulfovermiculus halophilus]